MRDLLTVGSAPRLLLSCAYGVSGSRMHCGYGCGNEAMETFQFSSTGLSVIDTQKLKCTCQVVHASCYGCSDEQRIAAIDKFKKLPNCCALLINLRSSTHSAVAGLNLTEATVAYMLEPCLNFGLEAQAIARISRIGQRHPTKVTLTLRFK